MTIANKLEKFLFINQFKIFFSRKKILKYKYHIGIKYIIIIKKGVYFEI